MGENIRDKQLQFTETLVDEWCLSACSCFAARSGYVFLSSFLSDFPQVKNSGHGFIARVIVVTL